ncbi:MAG: hypothetical protein ACLUSP_03820 [Christensenellales bacterium]
MNDKTAALIGFAIKAGKVVFGTDAVLRYRKKMPLIVLCHTLADNAAGKITRYAERSTVVVSEQNDVASLTHRQGCKAIAITDKQMSKQY